MPDQSMKVWLGRLYCDEPGHVRDDPNHPDWIDDFHTRAEIRASAERAGWIFQRGRKLTCPDCVKRLKTSHQQPEASPQSDILREGGK